MNCGNNIFSSQIYRKLRLESHYCTLLCILA